MTGGVFWYIRRKLKGTPFIHGDAAKSGMQVY